MSANDKAILRRRLRCARQALSLIQRRCAERKILNFLKKFIKRKHNIAIYWAMGSEVNIRSIANIAHQRGANVYLPYIEKNKLRLWFTPYPLTRQKMQCADTRYFRIPQFNGKRIRAHHLNAMILPLVGVDKQGFRLGQGGGFYDASFAPMWCFRRTPIKIGVGFDCQRVTKLPVQKHDIKLDYFICEAGIQKF